MLAPIGVQPSERSRLLELSKGSIAQAADDVNTKNSLKLTDSEERKQFFIYRKTLRKSYKSRLFKCSVCHESV